MTADDLVTAYLARTGATTISLSEVCRLAMELRRARLVEQVGEVGK